MKTLWSAIYGKNDSYCFIITEHVRVRVYKQVNCFFYVLNVAVIGMKKVLINLVKNQIVMSKRLGQSFSEMAVGESNYQQGSEIPSKKKQKKQTKKKKH